MKTATINTHSSRQTKITEAHLKLTTATCAAQLFSDSTCAFGV